MHLVLRRHNLRLNAHDGLGIGLVCSGCPAFGGQVTKVKATRPQQCPSFLFLCLLCPLVSLAGPSGSPWAAKGLKHQTPSWKEIQRTNAISLSCCLLIFFPKQIFANSCVVCSLCHVPGLNRRAQVI